jgi:hypothetical protein
MSVVLPFRISSQGMVSLTSSVFAASGVGLGAGPGAGLAGAAGAFFFEASGEGGSLRTTCALRDNWRSKARLPE